MPAVIDKKINILIFPAGSEIAFEIYNSLKYNLHVEIFGASGKADHARFVYPPERYFEDEYYIDRPDFIQKFNALLRQQHIDFIMPTHDAITLYLAKHQHELTAKVLTSPYETALIAREKRRTFALFKDFDFCSTIYEPPYTSAVYPVFLKPNTGQGGKGTSLVHNREELLVKVAADPDLVACEYLPGNELSVDCFTNRHRELLFVGPRTRGRITVGISFNSVSIPLTEEIRRIGEEINRQVVIRGAWFFQVKQDQTSRYKLMEFAVRQASTMGVYRQIGVNFALLSIFDAQDLDVKILKNDYAIELDRCFQNRYRPALDYERVYIDFDDTIVVNNRVNETALRFLYQCRNRGKRICLMTKHEFDLDASLNRYCLPKSLFDEIILLKTHDDKAKHLNPHKAIFIDNYFFDREKVRQQHRIPVFDVDAIESLLIG